MIERMHPREGRFGLTARIVVGSTLLALVVGLAFALVVAAVDELRDASRASDRSEHVIAASHEFERRVIDLETGERGFVITGDERFLEPFRIARARRDEDAAAALIATGEGKRRLDGAFRQGLPEAYER